MDNSIKNQIVTLGDGNRYFVLEETVYCSKVYDFLLNVEDEKDIEIVRQEVIDSKLILQEVTDQKEIEDLILIFRDLIKA